MHKKKITKYEKIKSNFFVRLTFVFFFVNNCNEFKTVSLLFPKALLIFFLYYYYYYYYKQLN